MVKAGALYYAIFISFFISLISGFMLLQHWYHQYYAIYVEKNEQVERDIQSAVNIVLITPEKYPFNRAKVIDTFGDSLDKVEVIRKWWGGFQIIDATSSWRIIHKRKINLCGIEITPSEVITLYLSDEGKYLSLAGNTIIHGNCYLPKLGVRKAYIEGIGYSGEKLIDGHIYQSKPDLPAYDSTFFRYNSLSFVLADTTSDSTVNISQILRRDSVINSFYQKTIRCTSNDWLTFNNQVIEGNIKIISRKGISIKKSATLKDIILYAPKIEVEEGFNGNLQMFVTDTLLAGNNCIFKAPSLIAITQTECENPLVKLEDNSTMLGDIVMVSKGKKQNIHPVFHVGKEVTINGSVYCRGKVEMNGIIHGQLFCQNFSLTTKSSIYENHLLNVNLNSELLSPYYAGAQFMTSNRTYKPIKWLY